MNEVIPASVTKKPLLLTYQQLRTVLTPYCKGKKPLLDMIRDIWNSSVPTPNVYKNQLVKMIYPQHFEQFVRLCVQENS